LCAAALMRAAGAFTPVRNAFAVSARARAGAKNKREQRRLNV
jgi:hypothetical protein